MSIVTEPVSTSGPSPTDSATSPKRPRSRGRLFAAVAVIVVLLGVAVWYVASGLVAQSTWNFNDQQLFNATTTRVNAEVDRQMQLPAGQQDASVLNDVASIDLGNKSTIWKSEVLASQLSPTYSIVRYAVSAYGPRNYRLFNTGHYAEVVFYETRTKTTTDIGSCALNYGTGTGVVGLASAPVEVTPGVTWTPCSASIRNQLGLPAQ
jgi:hypothetical protein